MDTLEQPATFDTLPLTKEVRRAVDELGYVHPSPVQRAVFEPATRGEDLVVQARTGTGKTAAFGLPLVDSLVRPKLREVQALVLTPTRELALQVSRELEKLAKYRELGIVAIYGGAAMGPQVDALAGGAQIVSGTPGRVLDHLRRGTLKPDAIRMLVLDEADEMLSMGFAKELHAILDLLPKERQGLLFSATLPPEIERLAASKLKSPTFITLSSDQVGALEIAHYVYHTVGDKREALVRVIETENPESAIVFCNTKDETERVADVLAQKGYSADWLNGDLEQRERERVMTATREGRLRFLVATDVAARGIDISHLTHVINHDFPESAEAYVHRTGRTGRAGRTGTAISLVAPKDVGNLYLLRLTYKLRPVEKHLPSEREMRTRQEADVVTLFATAFAGRAEEGDEALARRLLTREDHVSILAGMIRGHLGATQTTPEAASEVRRAKMPAPERAETPTADGPVASGSARTDEVPPTRRARRPHESREGRPSPEPRDARERRPRGSSAGMPDADAAELPTERRARERSERSPREGHATDLPNLPTTSSGSDASARGNATREPDAKQGDEPGDSAQLFLNVGRRDGLRAEDIQARLLETGIVTSSDIGSIRIRDRMTFVALRSANIDALLDAVVAQLHGAEYAGRTLTAERARVR